MELDLKGKNAFVCGSTQGIGKAIAAGLAELGANIILIARNEKRLGEVRDELDSGMDQSHYYIVADFDDPEQLKEAVSDFLKNDMPIHILINNSGGPKGGPALNASLDEYRLAFERHMICNQILVRAVVPGMKKENYGRIINVISTSVKQPIPGLGVSNTIRGAVASWSKTLASELGGYGITVNNILPGYTWTNRLKSLIEKWAHDQAISEEEVRENMTRQVPAGRIGNPGEIAAAAVFLATSAASYINGINMPVDGGRTESL